ncbi:hypothetical protein [Paenibacillus bovis]|uniref:hypothetical protein n=1 Tax=Paenibacillus bovis TaxID=1616788 RepID=UPI000AAE21D4|nr:hypothetical protein [Paenibacillus bovis]
MMGKWLFKTIMAALFTGAIVYIGLHHKWPELDQIALLAKQYSHILTDILPAAGRIS